MRKSLGPIVLVCTVSIGAGLPAFSQGHRYHPGAILAFEAVEHHASHAPHTETLSSAIQARMEALFSRDSVRTYQSTAA
jgi:hypothetical protein